MTTPNNQNKIDYRKKRLFISNLNKSIINEELKVNF